MPRHRPRLTDLTARLACWLLPAVLGATPEAAFAQWSSNPTVGTPVCSADGDQWPQAPVVDGAGGVIVGWIDGRGGVSANGVYAQRLDNLGRLQWAANGVALVSGSAILSPLAVASDGAGGVLIAWAESRAQATRAIYVQRLDGNGTAKWGAGGVVAATSAAVQFAPAIVTDGAGGAIVAWTSAAGDSEVVVQRLDANGSPQWGASGVQLSTSGIHDQRPRVATDGAGGAFIAWTSGTGLALQRVSTTGAPQWATPWRVSGVSLTDLQPDSLGGALVAWTRTNTVGGVTQRDVWVQRLGAGGAEIWAAGGLKLDTVAQIYKPQVLADGAGGAFVVWEHTAASAGLVRAQRVTPAGVTSWTGGGVVVCPSGAGQYSPHLVRDGADGIVVVFEDTRSLSRVDAYAQRMTSGGAPMWGNGGAPVCTAPGNGVGEAFLVAGSTGSAIASWDDYRNLPYESDLYATRLVATGGMGPTAVDPGVATTTRLGLEPPSPQPAREWSRIRYRTASGGVGRAELFDLSGRRVRAADVTLARGGGSFTFALSDDAGAALPAGGYALRLRLGDDVATVTLLVVR